MNLKKFAIIFALLLRTGTVHALENIASTDFHVFMEGYATNPAFSQMIEYVQLPKQLRKIIAWHRFPNRKAIINLDFNNTREVDLPSGEGYWPEVTQRVLKATKEELEKHPEYQLVLHANMWKMDFVLKPFLNNIPKERIKMIHLYEDGYGELFKNYFLNPNSQRIYSKTEIQEVINSEREWQNDMVYTLSELYPVTYHFFGYSAIQNEPKFQPLRSFLKDLRVKDIDFQSLNLTLTEKQKQMIYKLAGFDYNYYKNLIKDKKSFVFIMGYHFGNETNEAAERNVLKKIRTEPKFSGISDPENWVWFYKPHPSFWAQNSIKPMQEAFPDIKEISPQIPYEIFVLAGLKPTYTAGYSSSAFYPLNKEDILFFIQRYNNDNYKIFLEEVRHLDKDQFLNLNDFKTKT